MDGQLIGLIVLLVALAVLVALVSSVVHIVREYERLVVFFLVHSLIGIRFALARWRVGHGRLVNGLLIAIGVLSFWFIVSIR